MWFLCREIGRKLGRNHTVISWLVWKYLQTNNVKDRNCPGQCCKASPREDRALFWLTWHCPFSSSMILRDNWIPNSVISMRTVMNRMKTAGYQARKPIKCLLLTPAHKVEHLAWYQICYRWNLASWRKIDWSDESRFLMHMTDGRNRLEAIKCRLCHHKHPGNHSTWWWFCNGVGMHITWLHVGSGRCSRQS